MVTSISRCNIFVCGAELTASPQLVTLLSQGKYGEAEPLYERSQAIREKMLGPEHPDVAVSLNNRAGLLSTQVREPNDAAICFFICDPTVPDVSNNFHSTCLTFFLDMTMLLIHTIVWRGCF